MSNVIAMNPNHEATQVISLSQFIADFGDGIGGCLARSGRLWDEVQ